MRHVLGVAVLTVLAAATVFAQETPAPSTGSSQATLTTVDQVIEKWVLATGGKEALEKVTTQYAKGTFDLPAMGANGTWERYAKAPNKQITIVDIPGMGIMKDAFDGSSAWEDNPMAGLNDKSGDALALARREAEFHRELKFKELYPSITLQGKEKVGSRDAYVLEAKPAQGAAEKYYFDTETGLLVRQDVERPGPQGMALTQMYFD